MTLTRFAIFIWIIFLTAAHAESTIRFSRDIRPILSDNCYACHGPDENKRKAELRFDTREGLFNGSEKGEVIIPGQPGQSELIRRINASDPDDLMPPPQSKLSLTESEKALLEQWIHEGAQWEGHWAFIKPKRPDTPNLESSDWIRNPIDAFVLNRLNQAQLQPSPQAGKERLLRRVTLDLTGLPPTIEEIDAFLADDSPDGYEKVVERLLQSEACAERLALDWMDLARYADSHGMHADGWRMMWPWRDWVIQSFKSNMPYDQFVTWQLAGDLLPNPTREKVLATAFHRNHPMTAEGGIIEEEFRLQYVFDRAQTTSTAFLGMTLECARCHDHKFDPISQKNYYQLTAFFNNVRELGMTGDDGNYGPMLMLPTPEQESRLAGLDRRIDEAEAKLIQVARNVMNEKDSKLMEAKEPISIPKHRGHFPLDGIEQVKVGEDKTEPRVDGNPLAKRSGTPELVEGVMGQALLFNDEYDFLSLDEVGLFDVYDPYSAIVWVNPDQSGKVQSILGTAGDKNNFWRGWDFFVDEENRPSLKLISSLPHNYIHVAARDSIPTGQWTQIAFAYDGSGKTSGVQLYVNGEPVQTQTHFDRLYKSIYPVGNNATRERENRALRVGKSYRSFTGEFGIFKGKIDDIQIFDATLTALEAAQAYRNADLPVAGKELGENSNALLTHQLHRNNEAYKTQLKALQSLRREKLALINEVPEVMVMREMAEARTARILKRGQYDQPQQAVEPATPESILPFPDNLPRNRLGLARWLFHQDNPLTARVTVNRYWQMFFGKGLVETTEDFGSQGAPPTHPDLLDWMAVEFADSGWNVKLLLKTIATSNTYRQSSRVREDLKAKDPQNKLLARGPSYRLPAEMIRDGALAASGLLSRKIGGPSAKPYQPEGLWIELGNFSSKLLHYKEDEGERLYRRSLYTFIRRTSPPPAMTTFDAPNRDVCTVRREITNTPLQALVLMNDPQFLEAARVLAENIIRTEGTITEVTSKTPELITRAFRTITSRRPTRIELNWLESYCRDEAQRFEANPEAAEKLLAIGNYPHDKTLPPAKTAALTMVAHTLMNHDEFYMKR